MLAVRLLVPVALAAVPLAQEFERLRFLLPDRAGAQDTPVDFDGDGDLDLLGGRGPILAPATDLLLFRNERGKFDQEVLFSLGAGPTWERVLPLDANGDGLFDVLLLFTFGEDRLLLQQPDGSFVEMSPPTAIGFRRVDAADVDADGDVDLLYSGGGPGGYGLQPDLLLANDGVGSFSDASSLFPDAVESTALFFDLDGDGDHDILRESALSGFQDDLLENDGAGGLSSRSIQTLGVSRLDALWEVRDLDGDGDLDVFGRPGLRNLGGGRFAPFETLHPGYRIFFPMDWTGDDELDFVANAPMGIACECRLPGLFAFTLDLRPVPDPLLETQPPAELLLARDWDGDGDDDVLFESELAYPTILFSHGAEGFESRATAPELLRSSVVTLADADGDGDVDAFSGGLSWLENDGLGGGWVEHVVIPQGMGGRYVLLDWDQDGDRDVASQLQPSLQTWSLGLFENDGAGGYSDVSSGVPGAVLSKDLDLASGDLDGNGYADLIVMTLGPELLLLGNGDGTFRDASAAASIELRIESGDLGDLDRDGDLDAVLYGFSAIAGSHVYRYDNPGNGLLVATGKTLRRDSVSDLELADLDADGALDLVLYANPDRQLDIHSADGAGFFEKPRAFRHSSSILNARAGSVIDLDRDGWPDLVVNGPTILRNTGGFAFEDRSGGIREHQNPISPAVADLDLDGDLDLWSPDHSSRTRILWNLERQLAWHHWPLVGDPLVLDVRGTPGTLFGLWASAGPALTQAPGAFGLDPATSSLVQVQALDASGRSLPRIELPTELALVGEELHWQGLIGAPHRWSNIERTVLGPR